MSSFKVGDRVLVNDPGLESLRNIMIKYTGTAEPNHFGTVSEVWDAEGDLLIDFDDGVAAPYPASDCEHLPS